MPLPQLLPFLVSRFFFIPVIGRDQDSLSKITVSPLKFFRSQKTNERESQLAKEKVNDRADRKPVRFHNDSVQTRSPNFRQV